MDLDPLKRFASAADFRKAIEAITIFCDWRLRTRKGLVCYHTKIRSAKLTVVTKDCYPNLTLSQMKKTIRKVLARYVEKGK